MSYRAHAQFHIDLPQEEEALLGRDELREVGGADYEILSAILNGTERHRAVEKGNMQA